jgi:hypothetical protein
MTCTPWIRVVETNTVPKMTSRGGIGEPASPVGTGEAVSSD